MVGHSSFTYLRCIATVATLVLFTVVTQYVVVPDRAWSAGPLHIELTLQDPSSGGPITQNDALTLTAQVFESGVRARAGVIIVAADVPTKKYLCKIHTFPYSRDTCQIHLPTAGYWHIIARLTSSNVPPWRYVASASISLNVFSDSN